MLDILDSLFVQPLMLIYAAIFDALPISIGLGGRLVAFGVAVNLILLPVYFQMEQASRRLRAAREKVDREVSRMRRHFKGRERYFYVREVHRQFGYRPISALLGSADLFVQMLVFATVYRFLSRMEVLGGQAFGPILDLSLPDALLGGINVLPLVMTAVNVATVVSYVQEPGKRWQALGLAALFLALLYASPSGLVLYWTANNLFSFARNMIARRVAKSRTGWQDRWTALAAQR